MKVFKKFYFFTKNKKRNKELAEIRYFIKFVRPGFYVY